MIPGGSPASGSGPLAGWRGWRVSRGGSGLKSEAAERSRIWGRCWGSPGAGCALVVAVATGAARWWRCQSNPGWGSRQSGHLPAPGWGAGVGHGGPCCSRVGARPCGHLVGPSGSPGHGSSGWQRGDRCESPAAHTRLLLIPRQG